MEVTFHVLNNNIGRELLVSSYAVANNKQIQAGEKLAGTAQFDFVTAIEK